MRADIRARIKAYNKPYKMYTEVLEDEAAIQFAECMEQPSVIQGALMPDAHGGYVAHSCEGCTSFWSDDSTCMDCRVYEPYVVEFPVVRESCSHYSK